MKLHSTWNDGVLTIQKEDYIEDGWYIELHDNVWWHVYEIPQYGGQPQLINKFNSPNEAFECAFKLT